MPKYVAFLRAINVGGHTVKMDALRALFETAGLANVETFIASGNVVFDSESTDAKALEAMIEARLRESLGYEVATFLRTTEEVAAIAAHKPFSDSELESAEALNVAFLYDPPDDTARQALAKLKTAIDDFHLHGREMYWLCRKKQSESKFSNAVFERALKLKATFRGVNTVQKLATKYPARSK